MLLLTTFLHGATSYVCHMPLVFPLVVHLMPGRGKQQTQWCPGRVNGSSAAIAQCTTVDLALIWLDYWMQHSIFLLMLEKSIQMCIVLRSWNHSADLFVLN
jgi:hypothetical protein